MRLLKIVSALLILFCELTSLKAQECFANSTSLDESVKSLSSRYILYEYDGFIEDALASGNDFNMEKQDVSKNSAKPYGYRGSIDVGYTLGVGEMKTDRIEIMTSHGISLNSYLFVGIGAGFSYYYDVRGIYQQSKGYSIPFYGDVRYTMLPKGISPILNLKIGYSPFDFKDFASGVFLNPSIGCKFMVERKAAILINIGYELQGCKFDSLESPGTLVINEQTGESYFLRNEEYKGRKIKKTLEGFSFKIGFEF